MSCTAVAYAIAGPAAPVGTALTQVALVAGALTYLVITMGIAVTTLALRGETPVGVIVARSLHAKLPMFAGNVLVGLSAIYALANGPMWLLGVPALLWVLQRAYRHHLRAEEERRIWEAFSAATGTLGGDTEEHVAAAGMRGALDIFAARRVEIEITLPRGSGTRRYSAETDRAVAQGSKPGPVITREMTLGGTRVGELTVYLIEPTLPAAHDEMAVSAYAETLGGALNSAVARERLAELDARAGWSAGHDELTGLANRAALVARGDDLLAGLDAEHPVAVLLLDLNDFRDINGTLGYRAGDDVLRTVAARLTEVCRERELVARLGDDEFALLLPSVATLHDTTTLHEPPTPLPQAVRRAREVIEAVSAPLDIDGVRLVTDVAVGVVAEKAGHADLGELLRRASVALDHAKEINVAVAAYDSAHDAMNTDHLALPAELLDALTADDQLVLMLQPEVDLATGAPAGVEALIRWNHPRRGLLTPDSFVRTAENGELLGPFTRYVLDRALSAAAAWGEAGLDVPISVNVSARSLLDPTFPAQVAEALRRHHLLADRLVLEVTESLAVSDSGVVDEVLAGLREVGVQISVDDFGTGFSSLSFVTRVAVDELKVDRSFVTDMNESPAAAAVVRGAVELGARLGARVVAEGVETADQRSALIALGCTVAQGYHFSRPLPADKIVPALRQMADAAPPPAKIVPLQRVDGAS
jgi:diguanylate cyclase